ncbi:Hsp20/alpha crystallin family protein [Clostridium botulinum]|uniref:Hsp20/alpha crystallin family protein n=1 Tax=Clostridium botulinum TaxID=1491 RepID=A0AA43Y4S8_CLOBO|nr:Hsp20/alpha crystallin family protein [Clostridium botulinum]NFI07488.1 Hsp20/alpha crystallin family protein [Clostridium botulinum]NFI20188.1 Hsp20/alpha crystallin family protein [Clostridium botulinum]NFQ77229.1 Hsp20/alpha crystallin family protein [Clostridium botulinum]
MFELIPFREDDLNGRDDFFSPSLKNFVNDDSFTEMSNVHKNFNVDLKETDENYLIEADLPGTKKEDISIDFHNNYLVINAERQESVENKKENYVRRERRYGEFKRSFYIDDADENKIDASFNNGVLKITIPKTNQDDNKRKKIEIH